MNKLFYLLFFFLTAIFFTNVSYSQKIKDQVMLDSAGNVYVAGQTKCSQDSDIVIIKYNPANGSIVWQKKMGLTGYSFFRGAVLKGNYLYVAALNNYNGNKRVAIIRCDLSGNTIYTFFDRPGGDYGNAITVDNSNNVFVAGRSDSPLNSPKILVLKYTQNLDSVWNYTYTGPLSGAFDEGLSIKADASGNSYITGYTSQGQVLSDTYDYLTLKLNSAGALQWAKRYNSPANKEDRGIALVIDSLSNSYVTGYSYPGGGSNIFTIKYNSNGDSVASATFNCGTNGINQPTAMVNDNAGNIYITGFGQCDNSGYFDYVTIKYNSSLAPQWTPASVFIGSANSYPYSIYYQNSSVYVTGENDSTSGKRKFTTLKYNSVNGSEQFRWYANSSDSNYATSVTADLSNNVYISGYSAPDSIITMKYTGWQAKYGYCPPFGIKIISTLTPEKFSLYQNYPNPFNPATIIKFDVLKKSFIKLVIYDILGREVERVVEKQLTPGTYEASWDAAKFDSGVYFYSLLTDSYTETKKMVLLK